MQDNLKINNTQLRHTALITMIIDHVGIYFFPEVPAFRIIGRVAFPLYVFFVVQGYFFTKNFKKYATRLFLLALVSEVPYDLFKHQEIIEFSSQNVIFQLLAILFFVRCYDHARDLFARFFYVFLFVVIVHLLRFEYQSLGILYALVFFHTFQKKVDLFKQVFLFVALSLVVQFPNTIQAFCFLAIVLLSFYEPVKINEIHQNKALQLVGKYYYLLYPVQYLVIIAIASLLGVTQC